MEYYLLTSPAVGGRTTKILRLHSMCYTSYTVHTTVQDHRRVQQPSRYKLLVAAVTKRYATVWPRQAAAIRT